MNVWRVTSYFELVNKIRRRAESTTTCDPRRAFNVQYVRDDQVSLRENAQKVSDAKSPDQKLLFSSYKITPTTFFFLLFFLTHVKRSKVRRSIRKSTARRLRPRVDLDSADKLIRPSNQPREIARLPAILVSR